MTRADRFYAAGIAALLATSASCFTWSWLLRRREARS